MKDWNIKTMAVAMTMTLVVSGCNKDVITEDNHTEGEVRFSAIIDGVSRAYDQAWEANDAIGISSQTGNVAYANVCYYTALADGNFVPKKDDEKIYFQTDNEETFTAYYPWADLQGRATLVEADTWKQAEQKSFDFLWAQASGSKSKPDVSFNFAHKMAKLVLTVKCGEKVNYDEVKAAVLSLGGFKNMGSFNISTGVAAASGANSEVWTFAGSTTAENNAPYTQNDETSTVVYTLIFYPQEFDSSLTFTAQLPGEQSFTAEFDFTEANATKDGETAKNEWVAGRQYNMGVKLNKTGISLGGSTIAAWDEVNGDDVNAQ